MKNKRLVKIIKYTFLFILIQVLFAAIPLVLVSYDKYLFIAFMPINSFLSWLILKQIEKMYYKKYDRWMSMLYNICPLIGIIVVFGGIYYINQSKACLLLLYYYIPIFVLIYLMNFSYIIIKRTHK